MRSKKRYYLVGIIISTLFITYLHHFVFCEASPRVILEELYYIPLLIGALAFGLRGVFFVYLFVSIFYLPYFFGNWTLNFMDLVDRVLHLLFSGIFVFLAGFLIERERKNQRQSEAERYLTGLGLAATTIVHDLKNPLITILGFAKRLRDRKTDMDKAIQMILNSAENMQRVINGVLEFVKPVSLELQEEDIVHIVRQACESCRIKAEEKGVTLILDLPGQSIPVPMDAFYIQRALINLIDNYIEASSKGQKVVITARREKDTVIIQLKDFGSGMDQETVENIFVPFYTKKDRGTGLGMAIVKKILDGHHGKILIKSRQGFGTEVTISLPSHTSMNQKSR